MRDCRTRPIFIDLTSTSREGGGRSGALGDEEEEEAWAAIFRFLRFLSLSPLSFSMAFLYARLKGRKNNASNEEKINEGKVNVM